MLDVSAEAETKKSYFFFPVNSNNKWYNIEKLLGTSKGFLIEKKGSC